MDKYYQIKIAGLTKNLPLCSLSEKLDIAGFVMFGDVEITVACANELIKVIPECEVIVTAESKGIPLAYEMAKQLGIKYVVARKAKKLYMRDPIEVEVQSITTKGKQSLILDSNETEFIKNKKVLIVDDVISTGESLAAVEKLVEYAEGNIVGKCCVLAEGTAAEREDIIYLEPLPLFFK